jgi:hypothetical protein
MAVAAWPWTLVVLLVAFLVAATVATTALILLVLGAYSLGRSARKTPAPGAWRPSSNGFDADRDPFRPLNANDRNKASLRRRTTHRRPPT